MNKITGILIGFVLLLGSCRSTTDKHDHTAVEQPARTTKNGAVSELEKIVLAAHDSAMADMSELMRLKKAVKLQMSNVATQAPSAEVTRQKEQGLVVTNALTEADEAMMNWMHGYNGDTLGKLDQQHAMLYLKDQQQKVNAMRTLMVESIHNANAYLK